MTTERANFQIYNSGANMSNLSEMEKNLRASTNLTPVYLVQLQNYISARIENPIIRDMMLEKANSYPNSALQGFLDRFDKIMAECIKRHNEIRLKESNSIKTTKSISRNTIKAEDLLNLQDQLHDNEEKK